MTTSGDILDLVYEAVQMVSDADGRVYRPGQLPAQEDEYPQIKVRLVGEGRQALGHGTVQFTTVATVRVTGEASEPVDAADPQTSLIEQSLWSLKRQIELAVINSYPLFSVVQQLASVQARLVYDAQATMLGGLQIDFAFEFYEGPEDFAPLASSELDGLDAHLPDNGPGFSLDLQP